MTFISVTVLGYACRYCGKFYKEKRVLRVHERDIHEETRSYQCEQCQKIFKNRNTLANHKSTFHREINN